MSIVSLTVMFPYIFLPKFLSVTGKRKELSALLEGIRVVEDSDSLA